jgi:hypothetical protein
MFIDTAPSSLASLAARALYGVVTVAGVSAGLAACVRITYQELKPLVGLKGWGPKAELQVNMQGFKSADIGQQKTIEVVATAKKVVSEGHLSTDDLKAAQLPKKDVVESFPLDDLETSSVASSDTGDWRAFATEGTKSPGFWKRLRQGAP